MSATWTITSESIHTFTAPEDGWLVTSHIIEFPTQLFIIDAQYRLSFARDVVRYAAGLNKPVKRLYVTHYHPDHLMGASAFDASLFALESVAAKIATFGDRVAGEEHEKHPDDIPPTARRVDQMATEGDEIIDGRRIGFRRLRTAETEDALVIELPDAGAIIVQDLVYNKAHPFLGERHFDGWRAALQAHRDLPYAYILPGHGLPGGTSLYDDMTDYLSVAEDLLASAASAEAFKLALLERFPSHGGRTVLEHQLRFLFR